MKLSDTWISIGSNNLRQSLSPKSSIDIVENTLPPRTPSSLCSIRNILLLIPFRPEGGRSYEPFSVWTENSQKTLDSTLKINVFCVIMTLSFVDCYTCILISLIFVLEFVWSQSSSATCENRDTSERIRSIIVTPPPTHTHSGGLCTNSEGLRVSITLLPLMVTPPKPGAVCDLAFR